MNLTAYRHVPMPWSIASSQVRQSDPAKAIFRLSGCTLLSSAPAITGRYDPPLPQTTVEEPTPRITERSSTGSAVPNGLAQRATYRLRVAKAETPELSEPYRGAPQTIAFLRPSAPQCPGRGPRWAQRAPNHISKMVLSTVKIGPPDLTKSRTFTLSFKLAV